MMLGWQKRPRFQVVNPFFLPGTDNENIRSGKLPLIFVCALLTFCLAFLARLLEAPFWQDPAYQLNGEYLLATHDAYHWIAGAEGFEFGAGHPMSETIGILARLFNTSPVTAGFWLPLFMGSLTAVAVYLWAAFLGFPCAGICAGVLTSLSPSFLGRTLLGFCDTDLINLPFAVLMGLVPTLWILPWLASVPDMIRNRLRFGKTGPQSSSESPAPLAAPADINEMRREMLAWPWLLALTLSGLLSHWSMSWHSMFPYLVRFSALLWPLLALILGPRGGKRNLLRGAVCHALPLLYGLPGFAGALIYSGLISAQVSVFKGAVGPFAPALQKAALIARSSVFLGLLWLAVLYAVLDASVFQAMSKSFFLYTKNSSAPVAETPPLLQAPVFPGVARSIIEVQNLDVPSMLVYLHPYIPVTLAGLAAFVVLLAFSPALVWFVPLVALSLLSVKLGGRMTMYGAPAIMLSLVMAASLALRLCLQGLEGAGKALGGLGQNLEKIPAALAGFSRKPLFSLAFALLATLFLAWPLITPLPHYSLGPILSREHAEALRHIKNNTPEDAIVWNWWDWGYATHHFSRRRTIADGARHGGPSLYLPAAVYATSDPRFARQIIKHAANHNSIPGNVFAGLNATQAQSLIRELAKPAAPLIEAPGKQYLVVSFEVLRLGLWIDRYGHWDFLTRQGGTAIMSNISQGLEFNLDTGLIMSADSEAVTAKSIDYFSPSGLIRKQYKRPADFHFIFNIQMPDKASADAPMGLGGKFWAWQKGSFAYSHAVSDKLVVDDAFYNSLMVQLLVSKPGDPKFSKYFKLIFDNTYCRVFEVL